MKDYIEITFQKGTADNDLLLAALTVMGYEGFEEDDDVLKAYISEVEFEKEKLLEIATKFNVKFTQQIIHAQNWNAQWESGFEPVIIDDFVSVRAHFHKQIAGVEHDIIITPKMSFGTGHHATTFLMLSAMRKIEFVNKRVLDFGTGTGLLAILAEKLGAREVDAIDVDDWSIENANENVANNNCTRINLHLSDNPGTNLNYDVILANINRNVLLDNMSKFSQMLSAKGILLLSGLLIEDEEVIVTAARHVGMNLFEKNTKNKWLALRFSTS
jgi:ribosomal protein L11 methyltransferase